MVEREFELQDEKITANKWKEFNSKSIQHLDQAVKRRK
jgi:hypothetical protein